MSQAHTARVAGALTDAELIVASREDPVMFRTLFEASGKRCYTQAQLSALTRRRLAGPGRSVRFSASQPDDSVIVEGPRGARLAEGCAIIAGVEPARDGLNIVVRFRQRD